MLMLVQYWVYARRADCVVIGSLRGRMAGCYMIPIGFRGLLTGEHLAAIFFFTHYFTHSL